MANAQCAPNVASTQLLVLHLAIQLPLSFLKKCTNIGFSSLQEMAIISADPFPAV